MECTPEAKMKKMMKDTSGKHGPKNMTPASHGNMSVAEMAKHSKVIHADGQMMGGKGGMSGGKKISKFHKGG